MGGRGEEEEEGEEVNFIRGEEDRIWSQVRLAAGQENLWPVDNCVRIHSDFVPPKLCWGG